MVVGTRQREAGVPLEELAPVGDVGPFEDPAGGFLPPDRAERRGLRIGRVLTSSRKPSESPQETRSRGGVVGF